MLRKPVWDLKARPDGRSWEVWRAGHRGGVPARSLYGTIGVDEQGYGVRDQEGATYGPFSTLGEAAYSLTAREAEGDVLLLGPPSDRAPEAPPVDRGRLPRNRRRLLIAVAALVAGAAVVLPLIPVVRFVGRAPTR